MVLAIVHVACRDFTLTLAELAAFNDSASSQKEEQRDRADSTERRRSGQDENERDEAACRNDEVRRRDAVTPHGCCIDWSRAGLDEKPGSLCSDVKLTHYRPVGAFRDF